MKKRQMERWVKALRSGKFKQAQKTLHDLDSGGFCCLGVACEINKKRLASGYVVFGGAASYDSQHTYLPQSIMAWMGIETDDGGFEMENRFVRLVVLNDKGASFAEIADIIEQNYKRL